MKKIIVWILFMFICVLNISAIKYDTSIPLANNYGKEFEDKKYYLIIDDNIPFGYNTNGVYVDSKFVDSGYLNLVEFQISQDIKGNTYLFDGRDYYTMTEEEDKVYQIKWNSDKFNLITKTTDSNVKITEFVKSKTKVVGIGTYSNPWKFVKPNMFFVNVTVGDHACINDICPLKNIEIEVEPNSDVSVSIKTDDGYAFDRAYCTNAQNYTYEYKESSNKTYFTVKNISYDTECTLSFIKLADKEITYKENTQTEVIKYPGYYKIDAYGAQGGGSGGKGGYASGIYYFEKGDKVTINTGGTNGYNGGGSGLFSGGGATTVKVTTINNKQKDLITAAGGGGGASGSDGGSGTAKGGDSTNNGYTAYGAPSGYRNGEAGSAGTNGGGGGSSYLYYYGTGCSDCYFGENTCSYGCDRCVVGNDCTTKCTKQCLVDRNKCTMNPPADSCYYCCQKTESCKKRYGNCNCSSCYYGHNTCEYGCKINVTGYNYGDGGTNKISSECLLPISVSGNKIKDGKVVISYYNERKDEKLLNEGENE